MRVFGSNLTTIFSHFSQQATRPDPSYQKLTSKNDGFCLCRTKKMRFLKMVMKIDHDSCCKKAEKTVNFYAA